ncbi:PTS glucose transporter subunit IIA [Paenibacillus swuensis]|uniref:PTS glucose transporter subunit IIA n=1 Tax=Paenibacillus swuensis TaxID=1178515 RepID=A0A172TIL4_9BACL|nr:PTS glucose transporter subunit IIA [Paenibacillus swuensis]ANE46633.1 PTS glucose transporter subunit IIA [Paenibacillus swuensis]
MFSKLFKSNKSEVSNIVEVAAPLSGEVVGLEQVPDEAFAQKLMGDGFAVIPSEGKLVAPFDGTVAHLIETHHAVVIEHASGLQLLLHIGINTVKLKGEGFTAKVANDEKVTTGQTLIEFDPDYIKNAGFPIITPVVVANPEIVERLDVSFKGVTAGDPGVMQVVLK